ncbi:MAG: DUF2125 domain-containing protein [Rhodospirillales bacterium]|nr:DUF2125 domain-containing protein [Rhodospirillales bacterium]
MPSEPESSPPIERPARRKRLSAAVAVAAALAAAAYGVYWLQVAESVEAGVVGWIAQRRAEGFEVAYTGIRVRGFPFSLRVLVDNPRMGQPHGFRGWDWRGKRVVVRVSPWDLTRATVSLIGRHKLDIGTPDGTLALTGESRNIEAELQLSRGLLGTVTVAVDDVELHPEEPYSAEREAATLSLKSARATFRRPPVPAGGDHRTATVMGEIALDGLRLPQAAGLPLGRDVSHAGGTVKVLGEIPREPWPEAIARWRDNGGTIEIEALRVAYGPLRLQIDGTLALDGDLQPIGAFSGRAEGFYETVDALRERGVVRGRDATTARFVLGALARRPEGGGAAVLDLSISLQDQKLFTGPIPLMQVGRIRWERMPLR